MDKLNFSYDADQDILTVEGIRYSGEIFRKYGGFSPTPDNECLRIFRSGEGVISLMELKSPHNEADNG